MAEQKKYTDISMNHSYYYKDDEEKEKVEFTSVALDALVCFPDDECRTFDNGKKVINFRTPIDKRGDYIKDMCGLAPKEDEKGTVWANVSMWDNDPKRSGVATRFENLMKKTQGKIVAMTIVGKIAVVDENDKSGKTYRKTKISADSFFGVRVFDKKGDGKGTSSSSVASDDQPTRPTQSSGFHEIDDDEDLPF